MQRPTAAKDSTASLASFDCKICGNRRWVAVERGGSQRVVSCRCLERVKQRRAALEAYATLGVRDPLGVSLETFHPHGTRAEQAALTEIKEACRRWAEDPKGFLVLMGAVGSGKTHLAFGIYSLLWRGTWSALGLNTPTLLDWLRGGYQSKLGVEERLGLCKSVGLLVLDDLGAESATEWGGEKLYQIVDARNDRALPTVVTTNQNLTKGAQRVEERIKSRLTHTRADGGHATLVLMPSADYRRRSMGTAGS